MVFDPTDTAMVSLDMACSGNGEDLVLNPHGQIRDLNSWNVDGKLHLVSDVRNTKILGTPLLALCQCGTKSSELAFSLFVL